MSRQLVFYNADDSSSGLEVGLWVSDGTAAGTYEVGGVLNSGVVGASSSGLIPGYITAFGNGVLFRGNDSGAGIGLWFSDGTAQDTYEIGGLRDAGVSGAYQSPAGGGGLEPNNILTFGSKALFFGLDSSDNFSLWATDGTVGGTIELGGIKNAGISGAYALGFAPQNFSVIGNKVLFSALDTDNYRGLWVTDGTTAGTVEVGGLKNAGVANADSGPSLSLAPLNFVAVGTKAFFQGYDSNNYQALWVTDGTPSGTLEIGGANHDQVQGQSTLGLNGNNVAAFGTEALFSGNDANYKTGLWITDGTVSGTTEIGGLGEAGIPNVDGVGLIPTNITAIGNGKAVFVGFDNSGSSMWGELWATDGTANGTIELGGIGNKGLSGIGSSGIVPESGGSILTHFTSIGNKVVFEGIDASGLSTLWVTDGTTAGTFEIGGVNNAGVAGAPAGGLLTSQFVASGNVAYFVAQSETTGADLGLWVTDGTVAGTREVTASVNSSWQPAVSRRRQRCLAGHTANNLRLVAKQPDHGLPWRHHRHGGCGPDRLDLRRLDGSRHHHRQRLRRLVSRGDRFGHGVHTLTAQATNAGGTGTSNSVVDLVEREHLAFRRRTDRAVLGLWRRCDPLRDIRRLGHGDGLLRHGHSVKRPGERFGRQRHGRFPGQRRCRGPFQQRRHLGQRDRFGRRRRTNERAGRRLRQQRNCVFRGRHGQRRSAL